MEHFQQPDHIRTDQLKRAAHHTSVLRESQTLNAFMLNIQIQIDVFSDVSSISDIAGFIEDVVAPKDRKRDVRSMSVSDYVNAFKADVSFAASLSFRFIASVCVTSWRTDPDTVIR